MIINSLQLDCRFCSMVSKANSEDPIGTAGTYDHWLLFEYSLPWNDTMYRRHPWLKSLRGQADEVCDQHGIKLNILSFAPDPEYSQPGKTRVLYYYRPIPFFSRYQKQEFVIPEEQLKTLLTAFLKYFTGESAALDTFKNAQQSTHHIRELFVCTQGDVDVACSRFGYPIYKKLRNKYASSHLRAWRCSHFGGHRFAPTLIDLPEGRCWGHLESEMLDLLVYRNGSVKDLRRFYRGWAGLGDFEQILERELWTQVGWEWLNYLKAGQTLAIDPHHGEWADWAEVRIDYASPDGAVQGAYTARVEVSGTVLTQWSSKTPELEAVKQYRVSRLTQV